MELWIRSQDKKKLCVAKYFELDNDETGIFCFNGESYSVFVGKYSTKERALEILDEIQNMIKPTLINTEYHSEIKEGVDKSSFDIVMTPNEDKITYIQPNVVIYEMPVE